MEGVKRNIQLDLSRESFASIYKEVLESIPDIVIDELQEAVIMREMALLGHKLTGMKMSVESIVRAVENEYGVSFAMIKEQTRKRHIVEPRQIIMWALKELRPTMTLNSIAELFAKDHATVIHARKMVDQLIQTDQMYRERIFMILNNLGYRVTWDATDRELTFYKPTKYKEEATV
tara:strand:+ start:24 stop:551 length:528 start_codon:yes stop_codon:yes gene_type:complete